MVLFICENNSSLSPMAEALLNDRCGDLLVQSAGLYPSHVRHPVRQVLQEINVDDFGLCSKDLFGVDLAVVQIVIGLGLPDPEWRLPPRFQVTWWALPDPSCFPVSERLEGYRALRDELVRRIDDLCRQYKLPS